MMAHSPSQWQKRAGSESPCPGTDGQKEMGKKVEGAVAGLNGGGDPVGSVNRLEQQQQLGLCAGVSQRTDEQWRRREEGEGVEEE